jgi:alpha-L-fucosidase
MEEKEFRAEYDINKMVDSPPAGFARVDAFFTGKGDVIYAMLPRWPEQHAVVKGFAAPSQARITLLETGDELQFRANGNELTIEMPERLRGKLPHRELYTLKLAGVKEA